MNLSLLSYSLSLLHPLWFSSISHVCHVCSALSSSSYPWLVALWCLSGFLSSFCHLPHGHTFFGTGYFVFGSLLSSHLLTREAWSLFEWILISSSSLTVCLSIWRSLHTCCLHQSPPILLLTRPPSLLCCSMGSTGNQGERVCDGNLAVVRYEPCPPSVHAGMEAVLSGGGVLLSRHKWMIFP